MTDIKATVKQLIRVLTVVETILENSRECSMCQGTGFLVWTEDKCYCSSTADDSESEECSYCKGTGVEL